VTYNLIPCVAVRAQLLRSLVLAVRDNLVKITIIAAKNLADDFNSSSFLLNLVGGGVLGCMCMRCSWWGRTVSIPSRERAPPVLREGGRRCGGRGGMRSGVVVVASVFVVADYLVVRTLLRSTGYPVNPSNNAM